MSDQPVSAESAFVPSEDSPIVDDSITADEAGFESNSDKEFSEEQATEQPEGEVQAETTEELKEEIQEAIEEGATQEEVQDMIREFDLKVNGKRKKVKIDLSDEDELKRKLQLAEAGRGAMQEAAELKKLYAQEIERLKNDPWSVLKELDLDPDELAEQRLRDKVEEMKKSPEQLEKERIQRELAQARAELKRQKDEANQARIAKMQKEVEIELEEEITKALDGHSSLPPTQKTVARIADAMLWAMDNGFNDVNVEDVIPSVEEEIKREFNALFDALGDEGFEEYIGKKRAERLRKKRLARMQQKQTAPKISETVKESSKEDSPKKKQRMRDYFKNL